MQVGPMSKQETYYHLAYMRMAKVRGLVFATEKVTGAKAGQAVFVWKPR